MNYTEKIKHHQRELKRLKRLQYYSEIIDRIGSEEGSEELESGLYGAVMAISNEDRIRVLGDLKRMLK